MGPFGEFSQSIASMMRAAYHRILGGATGPNSRLTRSSAAILSVGFVGILGAFAYSGYLKKNRYNGTENYAIIFPHSLPGWRTMPNTPESLFIFKDPNDDLTIRGSVSQVISDVNPTPDLTTNGIAQNYIDRTHENMRDWTAQRSPDMPGQNVDFSVILRQRKKRTVITAFAVKGNTTLMVSISSNKTDQAEVDKAMVDLAACLKMIGLKYSDMGGGAEAAPDYRPQPGAGD